MRIDPNPFFTYLSIGIAPAVLIVLFTLFRYLDASSAIKANAETLGAQGVADARRQLDRTHLFFEVPLVMTIVVTGAAFVLSTPPLGGGKTWFEAAAIWEFIVACIGTGLAVAAASILGAWPKASICIALRRTILTPAVPEAETSVDAAASSPVPAVAEQPEPAELDA